MEQAGAGVPSIYGFHWLQFYGRRRLLAETASHFEMPFYYIDYVLAQLCAFQFKIRMEKDHDAAWADYMKLCRLSASDFYPSMLKQVGLTVPFTDGCIQKIVDELDKKLG